MCVLSLTHVACLMPVNHSHEQSKASPQMAAGSGLCCCLVCCGFCQNYKCDPERDLPATALLKEGCVGVALEELLPKPLLCLVIMPFDDKTQQLFFSFNCIEGTWTFFIFFKEQNQFSVIEIFLPVRVSTGKRDFYCLFCTWYRY